ncbi:alpha/beta hydrolase [Actinomadura sp. 9N407]|uniref:alpha/beta hydrolase n=1 Tax=Actinomadura sp. 9N407 TaxID=3375154 RepID=UPI00378A98F7
MVQHQVPEGETELAQWVEHQRSTHAAWMAAVPTAPVEQVTNLTVAGRAARLYRPSGVGRPPVLLYLHGGGWVMGDIDCYDGVARALAVASGAAVVSLEYRRPPEHPHPAALHDTVDAVGWLAEHGAELDVDNERIGMVGDSAGGQLAAAAALRLATTGGPRVAVLALIYPALDLHDQPSYPDLLTRVADLYLGDHDRGDPEVSPLLAADLSGLPPTVIALPEHDPLRTQGERFAARLETAGAPLTLLAGTGLQHGFLGQLGTVPEAAAFMTRIGHHVRTALHATHQGIAPTEPNL